jgi:hypothetical protein
MHDGKLSSSKVWQAKVKGYRGLIVSVVGMLTLCILQELAEAGGRARTLNPYNGTSYWRAECLTSL